METMTARERVDAVFAGRPVDVVPWFADLQWWRAGKQAAGRLRPGHQGIAGLLRLHRDYDTGIYLDGFYMVSAEPTGPGFGESVEEDGDLLTRTLRTPAGDLRAVNQRATDSWAPVVYPVSDVDGLKAVQAYYEALWYTPQDEECCWRQALYGGSGLTMPLVQRTPLMELVVTWCGVMNLAVLEAEHPDQVRATIAVMECSQDNLYTLLAQCPSPYLEIGDNVSSEVVGGYFRRYGMSYYQRRSAEMHLAGKRLGSHIDGTLRPVMRLAAEAGLDFVEGITPALVGDLTPEEIRDELAPYPTIVWGGVPASLFAEPDWCAVERYVSHATRVLGRSGRLILGVGDQVPPNGHIEYCRGIADLMRRLGPPARW
ncbi:MAG: hypothetical protein ACYC5O_15170 [Anaerolineae bacterium]